MIIITLNGNAIFNSTVCIIGIAILLIHVINLLTKKNKRKDENRLLYFFLFTTFHFATYLTFTEYLRHNLSSLTETKIIPFEAEFKHIQTYVSLEKVRFSY